MAKDDKIKVWLLRISSMGGGKDYFKTAYSEKKVSELKAKDLDEEWISYHPTEFEGEEILNDRVIVDDRVYALDKKDSSEEIKERALNKLSKEEKAILGLE